MAEAVLEHANITVSDPERTAKMLSDIFGWRMRWRGPSHKGGRTVHVGAENSYVAVFAAGDAPHPTPPEPMGHKKGAPLNHLGVVVDDLDAVEDRVRAAGLTPHSHDDYDPGRRFYFFDHDGIEFEVVSYE